MYCLKCGRDTVNNNIFCEECLNTMEQYPVKPGTAIQIPHRTTKSTVKKPAKRGSSLEEQVVKLKRSRRRLMILAGLLFVALCICLFTLHPRREVPAATEASTAATTHPQTEPSTAATTETTAAVTTEAQEETTPSTDDVSRETSVE